MMLVYAKEGHNAWMRMPSASYTCPSDRASPTTACLLAA